MKKKLTRNLAPVGFYDDFYQKIYELETQLA
jgi:hypothetical protein